MTPTLETRLTAALAAFCLLVSGLHLHPRIFVSFTPLERGAHVVVASIDGAVTSPGLYELPWGARVADLVDAAGGLRWDAEPSLVNLAMPLDGGTAVRVPTRYTPSGDPRISLNAASRLELLSLPGVGPALAERIEAARPFFAVDELIKVRGIGETTLERLRPLVRP